MKLFLLIHSYPTAYAGNAKGPAEFDQYSTGILSIYFLHSGNHAENNTSQDKYDCTSDSGGDTRKAHQVEAFACRENLQVSGTAAVCHVESGCDGAFHEVEAEQHPDEAGADDCTEDDHE